MSGELLRRRPTATSAMLKVYDDASTLKHALAFEAALVRAQAQVELIDTTLAERIAGLCETIVIDPATLAEESAHAGTLAIPLVARLRQALKEDAAAAEVVHRGSTSQDLADTVMMLQAREALALLRFDLERIVKALAAIASRHARTPAVGRTLLQDAMPLPFGLRAAQWLAGLEEARLHLERAAEAVIMLQFGGAVGTRAGLKGKGADVASHMGGLLGLTVPVAPWHGQREPVALLAAVIGIVVGSLGKIARDISLLAQNAIGEVREPASEGRGGSSAMPQKRNPTACQVALSAAIRAPGLVATILSAMPQELERGLGGWQVEAPVLADLFLLAGGSAAAMATALEGLDVDGEAMARNLEAAGIGDDIGEAEAIVDGLLARHGKSR